MAQDNNVKAFLALLRAGLWEQVNDNVNDNENFVDGLSVNWADVIRLAEEQSVVGIVAAGVERLSDYSLPLTEKLTLLGKCQLIEQQNVAMNQFLGELVEKMRRAGIYTLLLKGQGIAQCYERPLWRSCGDIDFFLNDDNYDKAKVLLCPLSSTTAKETEFRKHLPLTISSWSVELHGYLRCGLSKKIDQGLDEIRKNVFCGGIVRLWLNGNTYIFLPSADDDAVYIFTHILKHFYKGGIGFRQLCDWSRLLWTYRNELDKAKLEKRLRQMRLLTEWKAFAALVVEHLGMPEEAMPLYDSADKWKRKANRILDFILISGNFGHNRDSSYWTKYPYLIRKAFSMKRRVGDLIRHARIFPMDSLRFLPNILTIGIKAAVNGE